jgi:hypothetical protein
MQRIDAEDEVGDARLAVEGELPPDVVRRPEPDDLHQPAARYIVAVLQGEVREHQSASGFSTSRSHSEDEIASTSRRSIEDSRAGSPAVAISDRVPPLAGVHGIDVTVAEGSAFT